MFCGAADSVPGAGRVARDARRRVASRATSLFLLSSGRSSTRGGVFLKEASEYSVLLDAGRSSPPMRCLDDSARRLLIRSIHAVPAILVLVRLLPVLYELGALWQAAPPAVGCNGSLAPVVAAHLAAAPSAAARPAARALRALAT